MGDLAKGGARRAAAGTLAAMVLAALALAACGRPGALVQPRPLDPAAQQAAAERLARSFADACLPQTDPLAATHALQAEGWPAFGAFVNQPGHAYYAAKSPTVSPASLVVIYDVRRAEPPMNVNLTCVGHYPAEGAGPMVQAMERRWGASHDGPLSLAGSRAWTFRMENGALSSVSSSGAADGPVTRAVLASLRPGEALVYLQVFYSPLVNDVASVASVWRPAP